MIRLLTAPLRLTVRAAAALLATPLPPTPVVVLDTVGPWAGWED